MEISNKKSKYLQIFQYLLEFTRIRTKPIRNIEKADSTYKNIIWVADIPNDEIFIQNYDYDLGYFLKIDKPQKEPIEPKFKEQLDDFDEWVEPKSLTNKKTGPKLKESIIKEGKEIFLKDRPDISESLNEYIRKRWQNDLETYEKENENYSIQKKEYDRYYKPYKRFFSILNNVERFGEEYELILAVGLLRYKYNDIIINRHLFTQSIEISFNESSFRVKHNESKKIIFENDVIIDLIDEFETTQVLSAEKLFNDYIDRYNIDFLLNDKIKEALNNFTKRLHPGSEFVPSLFYQESINDKPIIYYAPAIILRKRNTKSLTALYEQIIKNIQQSSEDIDIPSLNELIDVNIDSTDSNSPYVNYNDVNIDELDIFFPKKFNDEQLDIIRKTKLSNKVLVQGPPGTGKSHTIANLICHLLALGNRVLITAQTQRALEVLKNLLPKEFQKLAINLLGNDSISQQELKISVAEINSRINNTDTIKESNTINELEEKLKNIKISINQLKQELVELKLIKVKNIEINKKYNGTFLQLAKKLSNDKKKYYWYEDDFSDINKIYLLINDIKEFYKLHNHYKYYNKNDFIYDFPEIKKLLTIKEFEEYINLLQKFNKEYTGSQLKITIETSNYNYLINYVEDLNLKLNMYYDKSFPIDLLDNEENFKIWDNILVKTKKILDKYQNFDFNEFDKNIEIKYPNNISLIKLKNDSKVLKNFVEKGNKLTGFGFYLKKYLLSNEIKEKLYFLDSVFVNGSPCDTVEEFNQLIEFIEIKQDFDDLLNLWKDLPAPNFIGFADIQDYLKEKINFIDDLKLLINDIQKLKLKIISCSNIKITKYFNIDFEKIKAEINKNILIKDILAKNEIIERNKNYLSNSNFHSIAKDIIRDLSELKLENYNKHISEIPILIKEKERFLYYQNLMKKIQINFPNTFNDIIDENINEYMLDDLEDAIYYKHSKKEFERLILKYNDQPILKELDELEDEHNRIINELSNKKAWFKLITRLKNNRQLLKHLEAWVMAVSKIGKTGTGKKALKHRKTAQEQMEYCKDSIPCWIMPLYKVVETIKPDKAIFDYIIIDEASQIGPDAIFLIYLSKNIIIVGDDKQVSPEYAGVDFYAMQPFITKYLFNIPFKDYYGHEFSFFEFANLICKEKVVLREHFRCMPEIIEFSNKYFYAPEGKQLYPLKQYSEKRLKPLINVYCKFGETEGEAQNIYNFNEALQIAERIKKLIALDKYRNKTFGVITLQGAKQSSVIEDLLLQAIGEKEFLNRKIICGNSASFQGDERDIIFLSLVTAKNHLRAALVKSEDERRFNVAASRAKEQLWLFHSVELSDLKNQDDLRYKLLNHFLNYKRQEYKKHSLIVKDEGTLPKPFSSWFEVDIFNSLIENRFDVIPKYSFANDKYIIDLVVVLDDGNKIAIDCEGDVEQNYDEIIYNLKKQKLLERIGFKYIVVDGYDYYYNTDKCFNSILDKIKSYQKTNEHLDICENNFDEYNDDDLPSVDEEQIELKNLNANDDNANLVKFETPTLIKEEIIEPEMIFVQGGTFNMGSEDGRESEKPIHSVELNSFYISKYLITQKQFKIIMGDNSPINKNDNLPINLVSWTLANDFIIKLNKITGVKYRLPTEAEWEYAAKGGNKNKGFKYAGSNNLDEVAWYWNNSFGELHPVGLKAPNELGIYDMCGNLWEWCQDSYNAYYYQNSPKNNPVHENHSYYRVLRGGSFIEKSYNCRLTYRAYAEPNMKYNVFGIRLVKDI